MTGSTTNNSSFSKILPVLFLEYLSVSIARTIFPHLIVDSFGAKAYAVVGIAETVKGILSFFSCPLFGRISDKIGRKYCLLVTMIGTTLPVCAMVFTSNMTVYIALISLSGIFAATFALTFAYISDCVEPKQRAAAYGLALATLGLSFTIGPVLGSYIAEEFGEKLVFFVSFLLVAINCTYIVWYLPETVPNVTKTATIENFNTLAMEHFPATMNISQSFAVFQKDDFMRNLALIVFLYYVSLWALVSTLMVYITHTLHFTKLQLGWLLTLYGICTMISEGVLVRLVVPTIGEVNSIRLGLLAFSLQCILVSISTSAQAIYVSVGFSLITNFVYPSVSALVSRVVGEDQQGEALGALNGIKALTEGFGPLVFGLLMGLFEKTKFPGAPYMLASILSLWALLHSYELPRRVTSVDSEVIEAKHHKNKTWLHTSSISEGNTINDIIYKDEERKEEVKALLATHDGYDTEVSDVA